MAMNKQRKNSNLINILSYDDAGNIVLRDYSQTIRYNWNGTIHAFTGPLSISSIAAAVTDTDRFLVSDGGVLKYRTGAEVLSDIGGVPSTRTLTINGVTQDLSVNRTFTIAAGITGTGAAGQVAYWNGTNSQTGSNNLFWDNTNARLGIGIASPLSTLHVASSGFALRASLANGDGAFISNDATTTFFQSFTSGFDSRDLNISAKEIIFRSGIASYLQKMRLTSAGRLLLGTTTEGTFLLDVNGTARVSAATSGSTGYTMTVVDTNTTLGTTLYMPYSSSNLLIQVGGSGSRMRGINGLVYLAFKYSNGNVVIGNDENSSMPDKLNISVNSSSQDGNGISLIDTGGSGNVGAGINYYGGTTTLMASIRTRIQSSYLNTVLAFSTNNASNVLTERFRITETGNLLVGSTTNVPSAILAADSTTKGFLPPRMTTTQKNAIGTPAAGLVVYDNTDNYLSLYNGTNWQNIVSPNSNSNVLIGTASDTGYRLNVNGGIYGKGITADSDGGVGNAIYAYNQVLSGSSNNALVQLSTTWNTTGNAVGIEFNVFNTASGASSRLIDLKVDLVSKFIVYKDGKINASSLPTSATGLGTGDIWNNGGVLNIV